MYKLITDYTIISANSSTSNKASAIESEAKRLIKDGWTPLGSITSDNEGALYQVMIKYTEPDFKRPYFVDPDHREFDR
jgi:hypothetical protein